MEKAAKPGDGDDIKQQDSAEADKHGQPNKAERIPDSESSSLSGIRYSSKGRVRPIT
jgi:hypothetical protein